MGTNTASDAAILATLGQRLARRRIDSGLTQAELARQAGVGRATVERLEAGHSTQMSSLVRVLRVLDLLDALLDVVPAAGPRPMDLLKLRSKARQRASSAGKKARASGKPWTWDDE